MAWAHDVPADDLEEHRGYAVALLTTGKEPEPADADTAWWIYDGKDGRPLAAAVKAACACGWRSELFYPINEDHDRTEGTGNWAGTTGPYSAWRDEHIGSLLGTTMPTELSEALATVERLVHQLATERPLVALSAIGEMERVIEYQAPHAGAAARRKGATWDTIGKAIRATRQAAYQRFARHIS
jgi:hypothetical protein